MVSSESEFIFNSLVLFLQLVQHHKLHIIPRQYFLMDFTMDLQVCDALSLIDVLDLLGFDRAPFLIELLIAYLRLRRTVVKWVVNLIPLIHLGSAHRGELRLCNTARSAH